MDGLSTASRTTGKWPSLLLRLTLASVSITTILAVTNQQHLAAQQVASQAPPAQRDAALANLPLAVPITVDDKTLPLTIEADQSSRYGKLDRLEGNVVIHYQGRVISADRITYDAETGDLGLTGHVDVTGGDNDEHIQASRGSFNLNSQTGTFYDVTGSVGLLSSGKRSGYASPNPFIFSGRMVVKTGPMTYDVYDGKVTSCLLPNPDWQLSAKHFSLDGSKARAANSTFHVLNIPILFLPYVTHPIDSNQRQSGLLIPNIEVHSSTKGFVIGDEAYLVLGPSADLRLGLQYFSLRGFSESGTLRYHGPGNDFLTGHFTALQDRGIVISGILTDQGGQDVTAAFRRTLTDRTRVVGDAEYLSSYVYREAFNESFNTAVSSDITSVLYAVNQQYGFSTAIRADRYQGLKRVPIGILPGEQVRIFHAPSFDFTAVDHHIPRTPFLWSMDSSIAGLKRSQPNFVSSGIVERLDLRPELSLPLSGGGWHTLSSIAVRETFYSRSRSTPYGPNAAPHELVQPINRESVEMKVDIRAPAIERTFNTPKPLVRFLGPELRHTVEPDLVYRDVRGIGNFLGVLRFDDVDVDSNTNELEYGVTQHVFGRRVKAKPDPCAAKLAAFPNAPSAQPSTQTTAQPDTDTSSDLPDVAEPEDTAGNIDANGIPVPDNPGPPLRTHTKDGCVSPEPQQQEWFSWRLAQRHFFDSNFGGAVINTRRNIFDTTLSLSGIAFLTEARDISPLISRMRFRTSSHTDVEWDFDLDTGAKKFTSNNIFLDAREGALFGGVSYARLNAPGRFYTETISTTTTTDSTLTANAVSDFSQLRLMAGYGNASKAGLSLAGNAYLDLKLGSVQYLSAQTNYNWNCCGVTVEYLKYELGPARNENTYKFSITLANIGTAGNLRKAASLF